MAEILVVDRNDNLIRPEEKERCHDGDGILHRAFSVFVFNDKDELLIQKRSRSKRLWPLYWSNTCCSHPRQDESYEDSAERRLKEELGISCRLKYVYKFQYQARYKDAGSENEICAVLIGRSDESTIVQDPEEIDDHRWIAIDELEKDMAQDPGKYTPWFRLEAKELFSSYKKELDSLTG